MSNTTDFTTLKPGQVDKELQKLVDDGIELPELPDKAAKVAFLIDFYSTADKPETEEGAETTDDTQPDAPGDSEEAVVDENADVTNESDEANKGAETDEVNNASVEVESGPNIANPATNGLPRKPFQPEEAVVDNGPELKSYLGAAVLRVEDQLIFGVLNKRIVCNLSSYTVSVDEYNQLVSNQ